MTNKTIKKLKIKLLTKTESDYNKAKAKYIGNYQEFEEGKHTGGFFGSYQAGKYINKPVIAEAKWNASYPNGYDYWRSKDMVLSSIGQQNVIDKINEIIDVINKHL